MLDPLIYYSRVGLHTVTSVLKNQQILIPNFTKAQEGTSTQHF
jgi:hypothetical protein